MKMKQLIIVLKPSSYPVETVAEPFFLIVSLCMKGAAKEAAVLQGCQALLLVNLLKHQDLELAQQVVNHHLRLVKEPAGLHQLYQTR